MSRVADAETDDETVTVSHSVTSADAGYAAALANTVRVQVSDTTPPPQQQQQNPLGQLIAQIHEWRNDARYVSDKRHTDRWDRVLLSLGESVSDSSLMAMTATEAQGYADCGWSRWMDVAAALSALESAAQQDPTPDPAPVQQRPPADRAPTVASALADAAIVNESGTRTASLAGVFNDADSDALTVTAASSDEAVATVSVVSDSSTLTVSARARGTASITVTASDGNGATVSDAFSVTVKAAPVVASAIGDVSGLEAGTTQQISLAGVFSDADGDALTVTASPGEEAVVTASVASDSSSLTGAAASTATITVAAADADATGCPPNSPSPSRGPATVRGSSAATTLTATAGSTSPNTVERNATTTPARSAWTTCGRSWRPSAAPERTRYGPLMGPVPPVSTDKAKDTGTQLRVRLKPHPVRAFPQGAGHLPERTGAPGRDLLGLPLPADERRLDRDKAKKRSACVGAV